jgi:hypothetical protein
VAAALYNELTSIGSLTDKASSDIGKSYRIGAELIGPASFIKYGIGSNSAFAPIGIGQSFLAGIAAKAYFITVPAFALGVSAAANQYKQEVKACGGG